MQLRWMADASTPPASKPRLYCIAGYIGGDTPHVWTLDEWDQQPAPFRLPIFTAANREDNACAAGQDAWEIRVQLLALKVPPLATVAVDIETRVFKTYLEALSLYLHPRPLLTYGSMSTLLECAMTSGGRWAAQWTDHIETGIDDTGQHGIRAFQWASATQLGRDYDLSVIEQDMPLWQRPPGA